MDAAVDRWRMRGMPMLLVFLLAGQPVRTLATQINYGQAHMEAQETGVWHCTMVLKTNGIPDLSERTRQPEFKLHTFLRYTYQPSISRLPKYTVRIQGFNVVDAPDTPTSSLQRRSRTSLKFQPFDPPAFDAEPDMRLWPLAAPSDHPGFKLFTTLSYPLGPVISGMPMFTEGSFTIPAEWGHNFTLTVLGGGEGRTCSFNPLLVPNRLDPRGASIDLEPVRQDPQAMPTEATVIIKPLFNMRSDLSAALIDRHIQHYAMIGFTNYIVYVLPQDLAPLLAEPRLQKWMRQGMLALIKWDAVPQHSGNPLWDQRVVYTHAVLAFLGRPTFLLMADLDEYLISYNEGAFSVFDMIRGCTRPTDSLVNLQLTRYHVIAKHWLDRTQSEQPLWLPDTRYDHPVMRNSLINTKFPPYFKTMVNPNFIKVFFVHVASAARPYNITRPDPHCLILAHACNVNYGRESERVAQRFAEIPAWTAALGRLQQQRLQWLAGGSSAAQVSGPVSPSSIA